MLSVADVIVPDWPAPPGVKALITTRRGGVSAGEYSSLNLGLHVGDAIDSVRENRRRVNELLPSKPLWLNQVHGTDVLRIDEDTAWETSPQADAAMTTLIARPCAVMVADCLPVLLCDEGGNCVAAVHAGWRGLAAGVIEQTVAAMCNGRHVTSDRLMAYLGPAIGVTAFEVGRDVVEAFVTTAPESKRAFNSIPGKPEKYLADIFQLARQRLAKIGVDRVYGGEHCTVSESDRFFSYRRDGRTGRMAAFIWKE